MQTWNHCATPITNVDIFVFSWYLTHLIKLGKSLPPKTITRMFNFHEVEENVLNGKYCFGFANSRSPETFVNLSYLKIAVQKI
jgi:hypothetical protein